jgi:uncharacterized membrane protein YsdA (DUF1294 family)/cold shock CspA family protein
MRQKGKIAQWDDDKGFGFIQPLLKPAQKAEQVFLHAKAIQNRGRRPQVGEVVTYSTAKDPQGRHQAQHLAYAGERQVVKSARAAGSGPLKLVIGFFLLVATGFWFGKLHYAVLAGYAMLSVITYAMYAWDKRQAKNAGQRTRESTLQLMALIGGWPGALLAQNYLRHKSKKRSFRLMFCATVLLNIAALVWLVSPLL